jgi:hypothetical protein
MLVVEVAMLGYNLVWGTHLLLLTSSFLWICLLLLQTRLLLLQWLLLKNPHLKA